MVGQEMPIFLPLRWGTGIHAAIGSTGGLQYQHLSQASARPQPRIHGDVTEVSAPRRVGIATPPTHRRVCVGTETAFCLVGYDWDL